MAEDHKKAIIVGNVKQLFIRDDLIESLEKAERVVNQPSKHPENPLVNYDRLWEGNSILSATVIHDEQKGFEMWYETLRMHGPRLGAKKESALCYAVSQDGIHWEKPNLGLVSYEGTKDNNIVYFPEGGVHFPTIFKDESEADPQSRYKLFYCLNFTQFYEIHMITSADGLNWNDSKGVLVKSGDRNSVYYDHQRGTYNVVSRVPGHVQRSCGLWESKDMRNWEFVKEILHADELDPPGAELYGMVPFEYGDMKLGFLEMFYPQERTLNTQLIYSLDGLNWKRSFERSTFLDYSSRGDFDSTWACPVNGTPIKVKDKLYIYYFGRKSNHKLPGDSPELRVPYHAISSVGLSIIRLDGFVSVNALYEEGVLTTNLIIFSGSRLHMNAEALPGHVYVELLDNSGEVISGYGRNDCIPMQMKDSVDYPIGWKGKDSLQELSGKAIKIRFYLRGARLYSFVFKS